MDVFAQPLTDFRPQTGTIEEWNEAYTRVADYLRAHRIHNKMHQTRLVLKVLQQAAVKHAQDPTQEPVTLAVKELNSWIEQWFLKMIPPRDEAPRSRIVSHGRAAMLLSDASTQWPYSFLDEQLEPEFQEAFKEGVLRTGPDVKFSHMVAQPFELGAISEAAGEAFEVLERAEILKFIVYWSILTIVLATIFWVTR